MPFILAFPAGYRFAPGRENSPPDYFLIRPSNPLIKSKNKRPHYREIFYFWRAWRGSNLRPFGPEPNALSTELQAHAMSAVFNRTLLLYHKTIQFQEENQPLGH
jgi:hypothetical protein